MTTTRKDQLESMLKNDPLYQVIVDTPLEEELYQEPWLDSIIEKKYYSTPEIAEWFGITDGQLRYYIKPFQDYLFSNDVETPSSASAYRLNLSSILRLRMIVMLKDEYRVKGLQRLIGIGGSGFVDRRKAIQTNMPSIPGDLEKKVESLQHLLEQIMKTGIFHLEQSEDGPQLMLREDLTVSQVKQLQESIETNSQALKIEKDNLRKEIAEIRKDRKDIAILMKEQKIKEKTLSALRMEAIVAWNNEKKPSLFQRLLKASQLELQREKFIQDYLELHLNRRIEEELSIYHEVEREKILS